MRRHPSDAICSADLDGSISYEPQEQPETERTHIVPCHAASLGRGPNNRLVYRALCGTVCEDIQHVAANPSCPECKDIDDDGARQLQALMTMEPVQQMVKSNWGNPTAGYRPKGSRR